MQRRARYDNDTLDFMPGPFPHSILQQAFKCLECTVALADPSDTKAELPIIEDVLTELSPDVG